MSIFSRKSPDFIAIGDTVIDAFIRLNEESGAKAGLDEHGNKQITLPFGEKVPFDFAEEVVAVGNSANASVSAVRLGLSSGLISSVGADDNGKKCLAQLKKEGVSTEFMREHHGKNTNYHYVLWYKDERTILIKHELFEYSLPKLNKPRAIYLSSVSENALPYHETIADFLEKNQNTELIFQPGTYQIKWGVEKLARIYARTSIFFCNVEEAERILHIDNPGGPHTKDFIKKLLDGIYALGPKLPVITDGPNGVYTYGSDSSGEINRDQIIHLGIYPDIAPPQERTGAGDAFASTFAIARLKGNSIENSLKWASINSMNVCQFVGAQKGLLTEKDILNFLEKAPSDWKAEVL